MIRVGMSTSCVYPHGVEHGFRMARLAGFDGIEIMVTNDRDTQDADTLRRLSERYGIPILSIHAPVLLLTTFVWGRDPRVKLERSAELAAAVGAETVVVHPPFRWQAGYARRFEQIVREISASSGVSLAVENMFPWRIGGRGLKAYAPSPDPLDLDTAWTTLDFSHASLAGRDSRRFAEAMGSRLRHLHLCDGDRSVDEGLTLDQHLIPGHGTQPVAETLAWLAESGWSGTMAAEVNTHGARDEEERLAMLVETAAFARRHLGQEHVTREPLPPRDASELAGTSRRERRAEQTGRRSVEN